MVAAPVKTSGKVETKQIPKYEMHNHYRYYLRSVFCKFDVNVNDEDNHNAMISLPFQLFVTFSRIFSATKQYIPKRWGKRMG